MRVLFCNGEGHQNVTKITDAEACRMFNHDGIYCMSTSSETYDVFFFGEDLDINKALVQLTVNGYLILDNCEVVTVDYDADDDRAYCTYRGEEFSVDDDDCDLPEVSKSAEDFL